MYLHPSVTSQVIDNSSSYVVSEGTTQLLAVVTADRGQDNKIVKLSSSSEYIFQFGQPNMKKYGQAAYNVVNWLDQKGGAYVVRVLPEDAGYAHTFLNVQTKESLKKVLNSENELTNFPNVDVRSTVSYTKSNNTSVDAIQRELSQVEKTDTIDGYTNHLLLSVFPKGRGSYYNRLGFRLTLTNAYDETYAFRLYNFEVTQIADNGALQVVEGPFTVSFDPDAVSKGNESLFIESVIENNSDYVRVLFNEEVYDKLGTIINKNVSPAKLDLLTGITRIINDAPETYFDTTLNLDVDIQIATHQYNVSGEYTGKSNYNMIESSIIAVDNDNRNNEYLDGKLYYDNSKIALSAFKKNTYEDLIGEIAIIEDKESSGGDKNELTGGSLNVAYTNLTGTTTAYETAKTTYIANKNDASFNELSSTMKATVNAEKATISQVKSAISYTECMGENSIIGTEIKTKLKIATNKLDKLKIINLSVYSKQQSLSSKSTALASLAGKSEEDTLKVLFNVLNAYDEIVKYIGTLAKTDVLGAIQDYDKVVVSYNECVTLYNDATDPYLLEGESSPIIAKLITNSTVLCDSIQSLLKISEAEITIATIADVNVIVNGVKTNTCSLVADALVAVKAASTIVLKDLLIKIIKSMIDLYSNSLVELKENAYEISLQDYSLPIQLKEGHSGALENATAKESEKIIADLMVNVFNGNIDSSIGDKNLYDIDIILDAGYPAIVKNAIINFVSELRDDIMALLDTELCNSPTDSLNYKSNFLSSYNGGCNIAIFTQHLVVADTRYTGKDINVTPTYFLASKIPTNDTANGVHSTFVGPRRGVIEPTSFKKLSFNPTDGWKEQFYKNKINYIEKDNRRTKFATQLTFQKESTALSQISNVRAILKIRKECEGIAQEYIQERMTDDTLTLLDQELNEYLVQWTDNGCCKSISGKVYASDYEKSQNTLNVQIDLVFTDLIERININLIVSR